MPRLYQPAPIRLIPSVLLQLFNPSVPNELILAIPPDDTPSEPSIQIVGQFDGSCMHEDALGGAGYVIYVIEGGRSRVYCMSVSRPAALFR